MGSVRISDIYAYIHSILRDDPEIQSMLGLKSTATSEDFSTKIQKRKTPQGLVQENLPLISFYKNPGARGENYLEYRFNVDFDIYTQDDVELAIEIADRIAQLFDNKFMSGLKEGSVFKGEYVTSAEDETNPTNGYKYFTQLGFSIGLDEN